MTVPSFIGTVIYATVYWIPTGYWIGVKELALPEFMTGIELEVYKAD